MSVTLSADPSDPQYCWTATSASGRSYNAVSSEIYDKIYDEGFVEATSQKNEQIKKLERIHELTLSIGTQRELNLQELTILLSERADDVGADEGHPDVCSICEKRFYKDKITVDGSHFHTNCKLEELTEQNKKLKKENKELKKEGNDTSSNEEYDKIRKEMIECLGTDSEHISNEEYLGWKKCNAL